MLSSGRRFMLNSIVSRVWVRSHSLPKGQSFSLLRNRSLSTGIVAMDQHRDTKGSTQFHRFLKDVFKKIPNTQPRSYNVKEFGWNDFNEVGNIHPHCHIGNIQIAGFLMVSTWLDKANDISFIGRSLTLDFLPAYHETNFVARPVRYDPYVAFLGRTSLYLAFELRDVGSGVLYMTALFQTLALDVNIGTPVPINQVFTKQYADKALLKKPPKRLQFSSLQPGQGDVFMWKTTVRWSDVDHNDHVSIIHYLRFLYDAGSSAAVGGFLKSFQSKLIHYQLKTYSIEYMHELPLGKEVEVNCWEMVDNPGKIHFEVQVEDRIVSRSYLIFYRNGLTNPPGPFPVSSRYSCLPGRLDDFSLVP